MPDERYKVAFEAAMDDVAKAQGELVAKQKVANVMAGVYGVSPPFTDTDAPVAQSVLTMKPDQFANCSAPSEAARAYLRLRGASLGAVDIDVIFDALKRGGFTFATSKAVTVRSARRLGCRERRTSAATTSPPSTIGLRSYAVLRTALRRPNPEGNDASGLPAYPTRRRTCRLRLRWLRK